MKTARILGKTLTATLLGAGLLIAGTVSAASGSLIVEQNASGGLEGSWTLTLPTGKTVTSSTAEMKTTVSTSGAGSYSLVVKAPQGANPNIQVIRQGGDSENFPASSATFQLNDGTAARVIISYGFSGTIRVESTPSNAPFELRGSPGIRLTGKTPAVFTDLPPLNYGVYFGSVEGCTTPRPQNRPLEESGKLTFIGKYTCVADREETEPPVRRAIEEEPVAPPAVTQLPVEETDESVSMISKTDQVSIWQAAQQTEVLPGGVINLSIGIRNGSEHAVTGVTVVERFDGTLAHVMAPLPEGAIVGDGEIRWVIPELLAGQSWVADFSMETMKDAPVGTAVAFRAEVMGPTLAGGAAERTAEISVALTTLPQAGAALDALVLATMCVLAVGLTQQVTKRHAF